MFFVETFRVDRRDAKCPKTSCKPSLTLTANEDPSQSNDGVLTSLQNRFTRAYLEFLSYQLERLNAFNRLFQSERPLLHMLKLKVESLIKSIVCDFMKIDIVMANKLNPTDVSQHVPLCGAHVELGATATLHEVISFHVPLKIFSSRVFFKSKVDLI